MERNPNEVGPAAVRFLVRGRVQGVGFRTFAERRALAEGVAGWVRNRADGEVEGEAVGAPAALERFLAALREGPRHGQVSAVETVPLAVVPVVNGFRIVG